MSAEWDEIRRLAADFQKVQLSSTSQRLSERNCVEVVTLLLNKGLIDVIFTNDGKEYLTPVHLIKEIEDELYVHGGRVNLVELSKILNVDLSHINHYGEQISIKRSDVYLILGQLLDESYVQRIAAEINEKLSQRGELSVSDLTIQYDLSTDFLLRNVMEKYLGKIIRGRQDQIDSRIFFTQNYLSRSKAKIRGALAALTRPTPVSVILQQISVQERIFHSLISEISPAGIVTSRQQGAQYIPNIYTQTQVDWVLSFYKQNGFLEYDAVSRLGVSDPKSFIKRQLPKETFEFLSKCCVGTRIREQVDAALDECIATGSYLDVTTILPSVMFDEDIEQLLALVLSPAKQKSTILFGTTVITVQFLNDLIKPCHEIITTKAKQSVESGQYQQYIAEKQLSSNKHLDLESGNIKADRKDERRRKATGGKGGGGTQGRETKTKSTKKHYRGGDKNRQSDSDDEEMTTNRKRDTIQLDLITIKEITQAISKDLEREGLESLATNIGKYFYPELSGNALIAAQSLYEASLQNSTVNRRQVHSTLQEKLNNLLVDIRLYEKGLKLLPADLQPQLVKYLLKTIGSDVCNSLVQYVATECNLHCPNDTLSSEQRTRVIQETGPDYKPLLLALNKTLVGKSIEEFLVTAETALQGCSMILKKIDKKKDRNIILCHKHGLLEQLETCNDPALILHLTVLIIFTIATQNMLHASGKHVSAILSYLQPSISAEQSVTLRTYHDLVLKLLSSEADADNVKATLHQLEDMGVMVKDIAKNYKKIGQAITD